MTRLALRGMGLGLPFPALFDSNAAAASQMACAPWNTLTCGGCPNGADKTWQDSNPAGIKVHDFLRPTPQKRVAKVSCGSRLAGPLRPGNKHDWRPLAFLKSLRQVSSYEPECIGRNKDGYMKVRQRSVSKPRRIHRGRESRHVKVR
eukprot:scaffold940_cov262-Pinguiococcus_pyrenoidosus.AAC.2